MFSAAGANIGQLNTVRKHLSRIKGGRLAAACTAGRLVSLILSDVIGDPLDMIASGPTVPDETTPGDALAVLESLGLRRPNMAPTAIAYLERAAESRAEHDPRRAQCKVTNLLIGTLALAVEAAGQEAVRLGYRPRKHVASQLEGATESVGRALASELIAMQPCVSGWALALGDGPNPDAEASDCLISGGEPTVNLADERIRGRGGRNQQLILAAGQLILDQSAAGCLLLSGGTDGEDGPTDAAGALVDLPLMEEAQQRGLSAADHLARNDAYSFFAPLGGLIRSGPTQTNVGDLRVGLVDTELGERSA
jgi:glycerate-2-kinase